MELDQSTLAAVVGIKSIVGSIIFYVIHVSVPRISGIRLWAAASFSVGLASLFDALDISANPQLSAFVFSMLLVSGQVLFLFGTAQFVGRPFKRSTLFLFLSLVAVLTATWTLVFPDRPSRLLALTPIYVGANGWMAWLLWKHSRPHARLAYGIAAAIMAIQAVAASMHPFLEFGAGTSLPSAPWGIPVLVVIWVNAALTIAVGSWVLFLLIILQLVDELKAVAEREERERIARDLHDTVLQTFQGFVMKACAMLPESESALGNSLNRCMRDANNAIQEGRDKIASLRAGSSHAPPLHEYLRMAGEQTALPGQQFMLRCEGKARTLHPVVQQQLCAIGREAICNAFLHAHARQHEVIVEYGSKALVLTVRDDGRGIGAGDRDKPGHWGLSGIEERARLIQADAVLDSAPGTGTVWRIDVKAALAYADVRPRPKSSICTASSVE
ncbi:histidine kinase [Massilia sp. CFBP9012]|uniref:sensor histidine kinase n=1 Tax=Massilia sp. CFBP9012 TaxID=3096531 RepID=UPI002A6A41DC|nr:histidine kinase [Massilia sp. CFBP9012]MDY0975348.1 histidine kinase [Massilia sp. CFBP9012]